MLFIKKYLLVSCILSVLFSLIWFFKDFVINNFDNCEDVLFEIFIPRINLHEKVYNINSSLNNVDYNVEILKSSDFINDLYFLAGHSGGGRASLFDDLFKLEKGDLVFIYYKGRKKVFVVEDLFYIKKDGYFEISYVEYGFLYLITCSLKYFDKQLIVKSKLIYKC